MAIMKKVMRRNRLVLDNVTDDEQIVNDERPTTQRWRESSTDPIATAGARLESSAFDESPEKQRENRIDVRTDAIDSEHSLNADCENDDIINIAHAESSPDGLNTPKTPRSMLLTSRSRAGPEIEEGSRTRAVADSRSRTGAEPRMAEDCDQDTFMDENAFEDFLVQKSDTHSLGRGKNQTWKKVGKHLETAELAQKSSTITNRAQKYGANLSPSRAARAGQRHSVANRHIGDERPGKQADNNVEDDHHGGTDYDEAVPGDRSDDTTRHQLKRANVISDETHHNQNIGDDTTDMVRAEDESNDCSHDDGGVTTNAETDVARRRRHQFSSTNEKTPTKFQIEKVCPGSIIKQQEAILRQRRSPCMDPRNPKRGRRGHRVSMDGTMRAKAMRRNSHLSKADRIRAHWNEYLKHMHITDPDFFRSEEAQMKETEKVAKGKAAYLGLQVNHENNHDIDEVYMMFYKCRNDVGGTGAAYQQFCSAIGQFLRFAVVCGVAEVDTVCEMGITFECVTNHEVAVAFLNYFDVRASVSTVLTKALHLKKLLHYAKVYFRRIDCASKAARAEYCDEHVSSIFNARKRLCRQQASRRRAIDHRISQGDILYPSDFTGCIRKAASCLDGVQDWFKRLIQERIKMGVRHESSVEKTSNELQKQPDLLRKWCINFLAFIVLSAGGQRPQVFPQLLCPEKEDLQKYKSLCEKKGFCELPTVSEKTARNVNVPFVVLPRSALRHIIFHARVVHAIMVSKRCSWSENDHDSDDHRQERFSGASTQLDGFSDYLLLNTETGHALSTDQVNAAFRHFIRSYDQNLRGISTRTVRPSYATMMFRAWINKKIHTDKTEEQFLQHMAMMMNTSTEQLRSTYIAIDNGDYDNDVRGMVAAFSDLAEVDERNGHRDSDGDDQDSGKNQVAPAGSSTALNLTDHDDRSSEEKCDWSVLF